VRGIHAYRSAEKDGKWLTMTEAAKALGVTNHTLRRLIKTGILPAEQVVAGAPYQIRASDLASEPVKLAVARKGRPCRAADADTLPMFSDT
jgi:excisionase family DNA binding protein